MFSHLQFSYTTVQVSHGHLKSPAWSSSTVTDRQHNDTVTFDTVNNTVARNNKLAKSKPMFRPLKCQRMTLGQPLK